MRKSDKPEAAVQVAAWVDPELLEWIDQEADRMDRPRGWVILHAVKMWRNRLERERNSRARVDRK